MVQQSPVTPFPIDAMEFQSQILPPAGAAVGWPPVGMCTNNTASWTWGYLGPNAAAGVANGGKAITGGIHTTYLGPVVIAETGVETWPVYGNALPFDGNVQTNLPIDRTLDWADPTGLTGPDLCLPDPVTGAFTNGLCGLLPYRGPMPIATHLHGGEVPPAFDGGPDAWFTQGNAITGIGYPGATYKYPNNQQESLIWFHDHALGITRLNVYAGLAGIQPILDLTGATAPAIALPQLANLQDIPLIIQDRTFDTNCDIFYNLASNPQPNPTVHPFWIPEFIGDTIAVNGKTWPYLNVEPRQYRFRLVNGSNARMYELTVVPAVLGPNGKYKAGNKNAGLPFLMIATDDGYLDTVAAQNMVVLGNGERYEYVMDFSAALPGQKFIMKNSARTPYPGGAAPTNGFTDTIMLFNVVANTSGVPNTTVAAGQALRTTPIVDIKTSAVANLMLPTGAPTGTIHRQLTLNEVIGPGGPLELVVNNSKYNLAGLIAGCGSPLCRETEIPAVGDTEVWEIINITADAHPMHTHLTSFQVIDRTPFKTGQWAAAYDALLLANAVLPGGGPPNAYLTRNLDGAIGGNPAVNASLDLGKRRLPLPSEMGWKDTVITYPGEVTRIAVRWAPTDLPAGAPGVGVNAYANFPNGGFDPTALAGPLAEVGYVWHCHIVDHEDNEMMRNYVVGLARQTIL